MQSPQFEFQPEKSLAVTSYLAERSGETMYTLMKMVYVADRLHLEKYGRPITGDRFAAMKEGACPSKIYDSVKALRGENKKNYLPNSTKHLKVDAKTHDVSVKEMPSLDVLSASDRECLDEVLAILQKPGGRRKIIAMAHDAAWEKTPRDRLMSLLDIAKSVKDGDILVKHLLEKFS